MYIAGIISEYNPFHKGHEYHIAETKKRADAVVCVMSGNFTQRGDAAVFSKAARARCAIRCGADLVVELPVPWAVAPAETFARGAVGILAGLGVDALSFGSESGDLKQLETALYWADSAEIKLRLTELLSQGMTFAKARETAVREKSGSAADVLHRPNDTLAVEYLREISRQGAVICPIPIKRKGAAHDSGITSGEYASASAVRELLQSGNPEVFTHVPQVCAEILKAEREAGRGAVFLETNGSATSGGLEQAVMSRLRWLPREGFAALPDLSEGLENRLYEAVHKGRSWSEICEYAKTKRYTMARIRRLLLCAALGITKEHCKGIPPYIKALSLTKCGAEVLRESSNKALLPIITRAADIKQLDKRAALIYDLESAAWDLYSLGYTSPAPCGENQRSRTYFFDK